MTLSKPFFYHTATLLIGIGVIGLISLSYGQATVGDTCPLLGVIPACYPLLVFALITFASHLMQYTRVFRVSISVPILIAIYASVLQFTGTGQCPMSGGGIPMCYISLGLFGTAAVFAWMNHRNQ